MNMFFCLDNFLSDEDFKSLNKLSIARYPLIVKEDDTAARRLNCPIRSRDIQYPAGYTSLPAESVIRYGEITAKVVDQIYKFLVNELKVINPEIATVWFAYMTPERSLDYHGDGPVRGVPIERCLTLCLYIHDQWEEEWGGEIESKEGTKFLPVPNRLVVWSRDVIHRVSKMNVSELPTKRMIMATTWTIEGQANDIQ